MKIVKDGNNCGHVSGGCTQVQLERIRQMESLEEVRAVLDSTNLSDVSRLPET